MTRASRMTHLAATLVASGAGLWLLAAASAVDVPWHGRETAMLRLSWSARPERIEVCRALSKAEVESRNEHMRQRLECDGFFATYAVQVRVDGALLGDGVVRGGGLRHDRPIHLLESHLLSPGRRRIQVDFTRRERGGSDSLGVAALAAPDFTPDADTGLFAGRAAREVTERSRRVRAAAPARLSIDTLMTVPPRRVVLVTFDALQRRLVVHAEEPAPR